MKVKYLFLILFSIFLYNTCDILRFSKFEIISWTPGEGYHSNPAVIAVSLLFSRDPDRASVERNFSLTGDGDRVRGNISWEGSRMIFSPFSALDENTDYSVNLTTDAHDKDGLSLDEIFFRVFTTRPGNERPFLVSFYPAMYQVIENLRTEIVLKFSADVPVRTLYENVSFSPSMTGLWTQQDNGRTAVFIPAEPWQQNSRYEFNVSSSLKDNNGKEIGKDFKSVFITGQDREIPELISARRVTKNGECFELNAGGFYFGAEYLPVENSEWEKDDKLYLLFSKPVDSNTVKNSISIDDGPNLIMETPPGFYSEFIFRFDNFIFKNRFTLRIKKGIKDNFENETNEEYLFNIFTDGKYSEPPELAGLRMPMAPKNGHDQNVKYFSINSLFDIIHITNENYPSGESVASWIELYFSAAEGASIDIFSVMELFRIETSNNVITFSPRRIKTDNFSISQPHAGNENLLRIEISGNLINSTYFGIINFIIAPGLKDTLGNINENEFRISLIK